MDVERLPGHILREWDTGVEEEQVGSVMGPDIRSLGCCWGMTITVEAVLNNVTNNTRKSLASKFNWMF